MLQGGLRVWRCLLAPWRMLLWRTIFFTILDTLCGKYDCLLWSKLPSIRTCWNEPTTNKFTKNLFFF